jgi:hypothetical protein
VPHGRATSSAICGLSSRLVPRSWLPDPYRLSWAEWTAYIAAHLSRRSASNLLDPASWPFSPLSHVKSIEIQQNRTKPNSIKSRLRYQNSSVTGHRLWTYYRIHRMFVSRNHTLAILYTLQSTVVLELVWSGMVWSGLVWSGLVWSDKLLLALANSFLVPSSAWLVTIFYSLADWFW